MDCFSMDALQIEIGSSHELILPKIGDAELRGIEFKHPDVELAIWLPWNDRILCIKLTRPLFFSAETDHMQNVIDSIFVYPNRDAAGALPAIQSLPQGSEQKILKINPISGIELICVAEDISFEYK
jgi:hypothetical protein